MKTMIKKIISPALLFVFGLLLAFIENTVLDLPTDINDITHNNVNLVNIILIVIVLVLLLVFDVRKRFKEIKNKKYQYVYLIVILIVLCTISYFWIENLMWK